MTFRNDRSQMLPRGILAHSWHKSDSPLFVDPKLETALLGAAMALAMAVWSFGVPQAASAELEPARSEPTTSQTTATASQPVSDAPAAPIKRTRSEVDALIDKLGKTPPDWWDSVPLRYPKTLNLTRWEAPPNSPWDQSRNIGQFFWSTINENPSRWKEGCRFAHFLMSHFKDDKPNLAKAMSQAAHIYGTLLGDQARSAFWYRKAARISPLHFHQQIHLAECYWKLGCKPMATEVLDRMESYGTPTVKLLSDIGELPKALAVAKELAADYPDLAYLAAGDACRFNGKYKEALRFYDRIQSLPKPADPRWAEGLIRNQKLAAANAEAVRLFDTLDLGKIPDGKYVAESLSYAGMLKVEVTVRSHRIEAVTVVEHQDKQYFTALEDPPRQIIAKQSVKGIDLTTSATITAAAVVNATAKALGSAMK